MNLRIVTLLLVAISCVGFSCADNSRVAASPPTTHPRAVPAEWAGVHNAARVSDVLLRGGQPTEAGFDTLKRMGIKTVVDLRGKSHLDAVRRTGLTVVHIPANIEKPDVEQIITFLHLLRDPAKTPVFVHDDRGADRVGLFAAAYRMVEEGWSADDAVAELPPFSFDVYWIEVPKFLHHLNVKAVRARLEQMPTSHPAGSRPSTRQK